MNHCIGTSINASNLSVETKLGSLMKIRHHHVNNDYVFWVRVNEIDLHVRVTLEGCMHARARAETRNKKHLNFDPKWAQKKSRRLRRRFYFELCSKIPPTFSRRLRWHFHSAFWSKTRNELIVNLFLGRRALTWLVFRKLASQLPPADTEEIYLCFSILLEPTLLCQNDNCYDL